MTLGNWFTTGHWLGVDLHCTVESGGLPGVDCQKYFRRQNMRALYGRSSSITVQNVFPPEKVRTLGNRASLESRVIWCILYCTMYLMPMYYQCSWHEHRLPYLRILSRRTWRLNPQRPKKEACELLYGKGTDLAKTCITCSPVPPQPWRRSFSNHISKHFMVPRWMNGRFHGEQPLIALPNHYKSDQNLLLLRKCVIVFICKPSFGDIQLCSCAIFSTNSRTVSCTISSTAASRYSRNYVLSPRHQYLFYVVPH